MDPKTTTSKTSLGRSIVCISLQTCWNRQHFTSNAAAYKVNWESKWVRETANYIRISNQSNRLTSVCTKTYEAPILELSTRGQGRIERHLIEKQNMHVRFTDVNLYDIIRTIKQSIRTIRCHEVQKMSFWIKSKQRNFSGWSSVASAVDSGIFRELK